MKIVKEDADVSLTVVGVHQDEIEPALWTGLNVDWLGFVDKSGDSFIRIVCAHDVGCLLSNAEAGGIVLREYNRLGLATLAPDVGGAPEHAPQGGAILIKPQASDEEIATWIRTLANDRELLVSLESVPEVSQQLQSFRSMSRIDAKRRNTSAVILRFSQSLASLLQRFSQAIDLSTIQRMGNFTKPFA